MLHGALPSWHSPALRGDGVCEASLTGHQRDKCETCGDHRRHVNEEELHDGT
jgi:hypothetical protein